MDNLANTCSLSAYAWQSKLTWQMLSTTPSQLGCRALKLVFYSRPIALIMWWTALEKMLPLAFASLPFLVLFLSLFRYFLGAFLPPARLDLMAAIECGVGRSAIFDRPMVN
jgi:hypothetical protein